MRKLEKLQTGGYITNGLFIDKEDSTFLDGKLLGKNVTVCKDGICDSIKQAIEQTLSKGM